MAFRQQGQVGAIEAGEPDIARSAEGEVPTRGHRDVPGWDKGYQCGLAGEQVCYEYAVSPCAELGVVNQFRPVRAPIARHIFGAAATAAHAARGRQFDAGT